MSVNLAVKDVAAAVRYYMRHFGFELEMAVSAERTSVDAEMVENKPYIWAMITCGSATLMLQHEKSLKEDVGEFFTDIGASMTLYMEVEDVDALYEKVRGEVEIVKDIDTTWYGQREFYIKDINGYIVAFASGESGKQ